ncbi:MAG: DNA repair protein [Gammaproteobacteria bacterium RIFCSPLOWO2_02_FULL_57_10]|nr:MAG: DNA repair protein [Gammaproteobacteria bacterium RIFCSPLOWO2_02_FULL_57_10]
MNIMHYKGYSARIEYSDEDQCLVGQLAGIQDVIGFHADSVTELRAAFEEAVDDYLEACEKLNREPQRPYSGKLMLRIDPGIHAKAAMRAEAEGKSLNSWAQEALQRAVS